VTDPTRPTDTELSERIRRSMSHYTFDRGLVVHEQARPAGWLRFGALAAAGAAGAVIAVAALGLMGGLRFGPLAGEGGPSPSAVQSPGPSMIPTATPTPSATALVISDATATDRCLAVTSESIQDSWIQPGETVDQVIQRLVTLPLLIADRREHASVFLFGDERFVVVCQFRDTGGEELEFSVWREPRVAADDVIRYLGGGYTGGAVDANGVIVGLNLPDLTAHGTVTPDVARIELVLEDGTTREARIAAGDWVIWLQEDVATTALRAYDAQGDLLREMPFVQVIPAPTAIDQ